MKSADVWKDGQNVAKSSIRTFLNFETGPGVLELGMSDSGDRFSFIDFHSSDNVDYSFRVIRYPGVNGDCVFQNSGLGKMRVQSAGETIIGSGNVDRFQLDGTGHFYPLLDNAYQFGHAGGRLTSIWSVNGVIQTSDGREKNIDHHITAELSNAMLDQVKPVFFRWKHGGNKVTANKVGTEDLGGGKSRDIYKDEVVTSVGKRLHAGFIAQDIKKTMDDLNVNWGAWGLDDKDDENSKQFLRPDQLIPILWASLKHTRDELKALKKSLKLK